MLSMRDFKKNYYERHSNTTWIEDHSEEKAAEALAKKKKGSHEEAKGTDLDADLHRHHHHLAQGGFARLSSNIIAVMEEYAKGRTGVFTTSGNPLYGLHHTHIQEANELIKFCRYLQKDDELIQGRINHIMTLNAELQAQCFNHLFQMCLSEGSGTASGDKYALEQILDQNPIQHSNDAKQQDPCKIYGILSVIKSKYKPEKPMGSSSFNDRIAWILKRELCLKQTMNDINATAQQNKQKGTNRYNDEGIVVGPSTEEYLLLDEFTSNLSKFHRAHVHNPLQPEWLHTQKKITVRDAQNNDIDLDLDQEVSICRGAAGFFKWSTKLSLRKYLWSLAVQTGETDLDKYDQIIRALKSPTPDGLRKALSVHRTGDSKEENTARTTGVKILDALIQQYNEKQLEASLANAKTATRSVSSVLVG